MQKIVKFKYFSMPYSDSPVLFKAYFIFKDFSRKPFIFKNFSGLCKPCIGVSCAVVAEETITF